MKFAKSIQAILPKGGFARAVALLAGGTALGQAITVLISLVLTRIYYDFFSQPEHPFYMLSDSFMNNIFRNPYGISMPSVASTL